MSRPRLLLDPSYAQALLNSRDQWHLRATALVPRFEGAEVWVTGAVLIELGDGMAALDREAASRFIEQALEVPDLRVIAVDEALFRRALDLYESRPDKTWGLTDCISFVVMCDHGLTAALTADRHFVQAGFRALLLEEP